VSIFTDMLQIKKPEKDLVESLLSSYELLAKARGFEVRRDGKALFFKGERISAIVRIEFGGRKDFFDTITFMNSTPAEYKVLVVSSNARSLPMEAAYTVLKKKLLVKERWLLIDIEGKKPPMCINWSLSVPGSQFAVSGIPRHGAASGKQETENPEPHARPAGMEQQAEAGLLREYAKGAERREPRRGKQAKRERRKIIYGAPGERKEQD